MQSRGGVGAWQVERDTPDRHVTRLQWGVKASFLRYVAAMPDGQASVSGGAEYLLTDEFGFPRPAGDHDVAAPISNDLRFDGNVLFTGHHGMLSLWLASPVVSVRGARAELWFSIAIGADVPRWVHIAELTRSGRLERRQANHVCFHAMATAAGSDVFNGVYAEGETLADVRLCTSAGGST